MFQGEFEESMYYFDKAIELRPTLAKAYSHRALARVNTDDMDGALRDARQAQRLDEEEIDPYIVIGRVLARQGDDAGIELDPAVGPMYIDRAILYLQGGETLDKVRADLEEAISLAQEPRLPSVIARAEELLAIVDQFEAQAGSGG